MTKKPGFYHNLCYKTDIPERNPVSETCDAYFLLFYSNLAIINIIINIKLPSEGNRK
jgi:hypothetical protein